MASQNNFGLFEYTKSVSHGDPYSEKVKPESKASGKQFSTSPIKKGKTPDVYFSGQKQTESVFVGAKYTTLYDEDRKYEAEKKTKQLATNWKPSSPANRPEGKGAYFGTFGKWENMKDSDHYDKKTSKAGEPAPRNFLTNPPIKGHKGLLGCKKGSEGVVGEYQYQPEPPLPRKPRTAPPVPFKPSHPGRKGLFSQEPKANFTTLSYSTEGPPEKPARFEPLSKPWNPSRVNPIKGPTGRIYATINPPPNYEPIGPKPPFKDTRVNDGAKNVSHAWRPNSSAKSMRSCSIVNMKRNIMSSNSAF